LEEKITMPFTDMMRKCPTLKELQEKKYLLLDSDLPRMLDDLLERGSFNFKSPKRPEEVGRTAAPNIVVTIGW